MSVNKWRLKKELVSYWTNWLKEHPPICHPQELWDMAQGKAQVTHYMDEFWSKEKEYFRKHRIKKVDFKEAFSEAIGKMNIYSYRNKKKELLLDITFKLGKALARLTSKEIILPLEGVEKLEKGPYKITTLTDEEFDEEEILIDKIDQERERDPEKLRQKGMSLRDISEKTGIPKSTLHRRLKKLRK